MAETVRCPIRLVYIRKYKDGTVEIERHNCKFDDQHTEDHECGCGNKWSESALINAEVDLA